MIKGRPRSTPDITYTAPNGERWKVERFDELQESFEVTVATMPDLHAVGDEDPSRAWEAVRMLYGIHGAYVVGYQLFTPDEIAQVLSLHGDTYRPSDIEQMVATIREAWRKHEPTSGKVNFVPLPELPPLPPELEKAVEADLATIQRFGFNRKHFDLPGRDAFERAAEIAWLSARLISLQKMFEEPMAVGVARQALINEVLLRRCDDKMMTFDISSKEFSGAQASKDGIEQEYRKQWEQLEEICPFIKHITRQIEVLGNCSDLVKAVRDWKADGRNDLVDGIFTAFGIQIEMRASVQAPEPRYRPGWVAAMLDAKDGWRDPKWKPRVPRWLTKLMDDSLREAHAKAVESGKLKLTDLEAEGPTGEYPPLVEAEAETTEGEEHLPMPEEGAPLEETPA